jgi:hypothetical protein
VARSAVDHTGPAFQYHERGTVVPGFP